MPSPRCSGQIHSPGQIGVQLDDPVAVEHELADEAAMAPHVAHDSVVLVPANVLIALLGGVEAEVGHGHPRHEELDLTWSLVQAVAANRHEAVERRSGQVTVQRSFYRLDTAPRPRQGACP